MRIGQHLINSREVSQRRLSLLNALNSANLFPKANADNQSINQKMCIVAYHCNSFTAYFFHRPITCKASLEYNRVGMITHEYMCVSSGQLEKLWMGFNEFLEVESMVLGHPRPQKKVLTFVLRVQSFILIDRVTIFGAVTPGGRCLGVDSALHAHRG